MLMVAALLLAGCAGPGRSQVTLRVAAASDLQYALGAVAEGFTADRSGVKVEVSYGSSGELYQQLTDGAEYEVFLAADIAYAQRLVDDGEAPETDLFRYAQGRLALWAGDQSPVDPTRGMAALRDAERVAIADPADSPYGRAAEAALRNAGLYDELDGRLLLGDSVGQAADLVAEGEADAGLIALAQVAAGPRRDVGQWREVPARYYQLLDQGGVVPLAAAHPAVARSFRDYLISPDGQQILQRYGFGPPAD